MNFHYTLLLLFFLIISSCQTQQPLLDQDKKEINIFLDQWHHAAAIADDESFFNAFTKDAIYIGTDPTEHWTAEELKILFKPAFEKETAWDFKPYNRHIYSSKNDDIIWFDELLDTWMGPCRGSGILMKENKNWKIAHYHLSVAVPNNVIETYLKIIKDKPIE